MSQLEEVMTEKRKKNNREYQHTIAEAYWVLMTQRNLLVYLNRVSQVKREELSVFIYKPLQFVFCLTW